MKSFPDPVFSLAFPVTSHLVFQIVADSRLPHGTTPMATDDDAPHRVIRISAADADDHECDEPDRLAGLITDAVVMGRSVQADAVRNIREVVHEWLCKRRGEAALNAHEKE